MENFFMSEDDIACLQDSEMFDWIARLGGVPAGAHPIDDGLLMSLYAALAYRVSVGAELRSGRRIQVIPSYLWQWRARRPRLRSRDLFTAYRQSSLFETSEGERLEGEQIFTRLLAILILRAKHVDIVAIRGTVDFHDVVTDLNDRLFAVETGKDAVRFHEGFYVAAAEASAELQDVLRRRAAQRVYVTGHSLGGAIAAIYHAHVRLLPGVKFHQCYTFGMPRYGNQRAVQSRPVPAHVHFEREVDRVPGIPSRRSFAEARPSYEILVNGAARGRRCEHAGAPVRRGWPGRVAKWAKTPGHFIEHYVAALQCMAGSCSLHQDLAWLERP